ncbi:transglutaminase family protein [Pikeienuella piscinae]|uniref:Transglutaminase family protein n=1 Tax=Pikeienuella piscinae TaxID=2748098 RepID=A0A7L5BT58_9RHOB|nr:transglutaminase family protein [Pikeienuella piscinae]QIE54111.1 transglutaminase family protein [Pikeienuella piscinae]
MLLSIRHRTFYRYDPPAARVALKLRLYPAVTAAQTPRSWSVTVNGEAPHMRLANGYGDEESVWLAHDGAEEVEIVAEGVVETRDVHGVLRGWRMAARPAMFLRKTPLTAPDEAITALAKEATAGKTGISAAHALSEAVRDAVDYRPGATTAKTTAAETLNLGAGVCQDHTHLLISGARSLGAAARYVVGYLMVGEGDQPELSTEQETHAWAEIWIDSLGWVGFDASNRICPTDHYVRLAAGLDAPDAAPLRGSITGAAEETLEADVQVTQAQ